MSPAQVASPPTRDREAATCPATAGWSGKLLDESSMSDGNEGGRMMTDATRPDHDWSAPDSVLTVLVDAANAHVERDGKSVQALTLTVGGLVVTGNLIPAWQWFEELHVAAGVPPSDEPSWLQAMANTYRENAETVREAYSLSVQEQTDEHVAALDHETHFIHLRDAKIMTPAGSMPTGDGWFWRGRLADVSGWMLGSLGTSD
jgi:hypothetical protein